MKTKFRNSVIPAAFSALLLSAVSTNSLAATVSVSLGPSYSLESGQTHHVSNALSSVMYDVAKARSDLKDDKGTAAKDELVKAQATLKSVETTYGNGTASINLSATHHDLNLSLMDAERETNMRSLRQLDQAKAALKTGQLDRASHIVDAVDYPLVFAEIDIPISQTGAGLSKAINLINSGKLDEADQALDITQDAAQTDAGLFGGDF